MCVYMYIYVYVYIYMYIYIYYTFLNRISELFDILVDYPDSVPALMDLKLCLATLHKRSFLISSLKAV